MYNSAAAEEKNNAAGEKDSVLDPLLPNSIDEDAIIDKDGSIRTVANENASSSQWQKQEEELEEIEAAFLSATLNEDRAPPDPHKNSNTAAAATTSITSDNEDEEEKGECPICTHFSKPPCGELFKSFLNCTDEFRDTDYEVKCQDEFQAWNTCLMNNFEAYDLEPRDAADYKKNPEDQANQANEE